MPFTKEQLRVHRQKLKAKGICTVCHKNKADATPSVCKPCKQLQRDRRKKRMLDGVLCKYCTRPVFKNGVCAVCTLATNKRISRKRQRWARNGLCGTCGGPKDDPGRFNCVNCLERNRVGRSIRDSL